MYLLDSDGAGFDRAGVIGTIAPERLDANAARALLDRIRGGYLERDQLLREIDELGGTPDAEARRAPLLALDGLAVTIDGARREEAIPGEVMHRPRARCRPWQLAETAWVPVREFRTPDTTAGPRTNAGQTVTVRSADKLRSFQAAQGGAIWQTQAPSYGTRGSRTHATVVPSSTHALPR